MRYKLLCGNDGPDAKQLVLWKIIKASGEPFNLFSRDSLFLQVVFYEFL